MSTTVHPPPPSSDPASSLRAAALLTIKSKRKRPTTTHLPVDNTPQLDYGHDDNVTLSPTDTASINPRLRPIKRTSIDVSSPYTRTTQEDREDSQIREEGEISDSEDPTPTTKVPPSKPPRIPEFQEDVTTLCHKSAQIEPLASTHPPFPIPVISGAFALHESSQELEMGEPSSSRTPLVESNHVRPGLVLNQAQYDQAKDLVLDILGWGVPPEYLIDCGLSREIVFYVFNELQLRLPTNLDTTGLIPYLPPDNNIPSGLLALVSPPRFGSRLGQENSSHALQIGAPAAPPKLAASLQPAFQPTPVSPSLNDIEQQRRKELLARKALQLPRKNRFEDSPFSPLPGARDQDVEMTPNPVHKEAVDDFLKTIAADVDMGDGAVVVEQGGISERRNSDSQMDVDHATPTNSVEHRSSLTSSLPAQSFSFVISPTCSETSTGITASITLPVSSEPSRQASLERSTSAPARRIPKRPVAADFVDLDTDPAPPRLQHVRNIGKSSPGNNDPSAIRRSTFAGVSSMKRCIIEVSDSEDDDGILEVVETAADGSVKNVTRYTPSNGSLLGKRQAILPAIPTTAAALRKDNSGANSPISLVEKEQEIRQMREMIAKKEQSRLMKMSSLSRSNSMTLPSASDAAQENGSLLSDVQPRGDRQDNRIERTASDAVDSLVKPRSSSPVSSSSSSVGGVTSGATIGTPSGADGEGERGSVMSTSSPAARTALPSLLQTLTFVSQQDAEDALASSSFAQMAATTPSPENANEVRDDIYAAYVSPFEGIPFLRARTASTSLEYCNNPPESLATFATSLASSASASSASSSSTVPVVSVPDLRPLTMVLHSDPMKHLCIYETSGGVCRDPSCQDLHIEHRKSLSEEGADRQYDDQEIAEFVYGSLPGDTQSRYSVATLAAALGRQGAKTIEKRVESALQAVLEGRV